MSSSNCCFLTCIQISQVAGEVVWYSHFFKNFPQFVVIHTVKGVGIVNKAEIDVFLKLSCFFDDPTDVGNLISGSTAFSKTSLNIWKFMVHILLKADLENFEHYYASMWDEYNGAVVWAFFGMAFVSACLIIILNFLQTQFKNFFNLIKNALRMIMLNFLKTQFLSGTLLLFVYVLSLSPH